MPMSLRLRLQQKKVQALEETYESWKTDHAQAMLARDLEDLVEECSAVAEDLPRLWAWTWEDVTAGRVEDLDVLGRALDALFERITQLLNGVGANVGEWTRHTGHTIDNCEKLRTATAAVSALRDRVMKHWPWADRPWPPLDRDMQQRSRSGQDGPGEPVEDILRRLQSGGPLIAE